MEIEVVRTRNVPDDALLSIRAGNTRRQGQLKSGKCDPLKFPQNPKDLSGIKIDLLNVLGSCRMPIEGTTQYEYSTDIDHITGDAEKKMHVTFSLRCPDTPGFTHTPAASMISSSGKKIGFSDLDLDKDGVVTKSEFDTALKDHVVTGVEIERGSETEKADWEKKRERTAKDYVQQHGLDTFIRYLMSSLMKDKPHDPWQFLLQQITKRWAQVRLQENGEKQSTIEELLAQNNLELPPPPVTLESLHSVQKDAMNTGESLCDDNKRLRDVAKKLHAELLEDSNRLRGHIGSRPVSPAGPDLPPASPSRWKVDKTLEPIEGETPQTFAYREISVAQEEVCNLARENSSLVDEIANIRAEIEKLRKHGTSVGDEQLVQNGQSPFKLITCSKDQAT